MKTHHQITAISSSGGDPNPASDRNLRQDENQNYHHPLQQIAESGSHRLLLKQWLKEEASIARRVCRQEARLDATNNQVAHLCCCFFAFHAIVLALLYYSAATNPGVSCRKAWMPSVLSIVASLVMIWAIRYKMDVQAHIQRLLRREEEDSRLMSKCVLELKTKGTSFDLLKEVDILRRAKSLRVSSEAKSVMRLSYRDIVTLLFVAMSSVVLVFTRLLLCKS